MRCVDPTDFKNIASLAIDASESGLLTPTTTGFFVIRMRDPWTMTQPQAKYHPPPQQNPITGLDTGVIDQRRETNELQQQQIDILMAVMNDK